MTANSSLVSGEIDSFYSLVQGLPEDGFCSGTTCFIASGGQSRGAANRGSRKIYCLGKCYAAPADVIHEGEFRIGIHASESVVISKIQGGPVKNLEAYLESGGFNGFRSAVKLGRKKIVDYLEESGLRGRGGAGFPTGRKWRSVQQQNSSEKYVVMNGDEGDPGSYIDRVLMEYNPYLLIEAMEIAGYAVGSGAGFAYIRTEYPHSIERFARAIEEMKAANLLGENVEESKFSFNITLKRGLGSYVCGEETALMRSIEGKRPEVSVRPPYPTERGLFGKPTLINNVETFASVPWIMQNGPQRYASMGYGKSRGTKLISLNSVFRTPGLYEVEFGTPIRYIVENLGGGLKKGSVKGLMLGGPLSGILTPEKLDIPLDYESLRQNGTSLGHGGIIAFGDDVGIPELMEHVASFASDESCGKCTPCRSGSRYLRNFFHDMNTGQSPKPESPDFFRRTVKSLRDASLCGLGTGLAEFADSAIKGYPEEVVKWFR